MTTREGEKAPGMPITNNLFLKNQPPGPVIPKILIFKYVLKGGFESIPHTSILADLICSGTYRTMSRTSHKNQSQVYNGQTD